MSDEYTQVASTRTEAYQAINCAYDVAKALLANGKRAKITVVEDFDPVSLKQRRFLHGPVLTQISEQVRVKGRLFIRDVWKEYFRREFLGSRYEVYALPGAKRATPHQIRNSTEELNTKQYSEYIDRVIAHAVTEWNVAFRFNEWERNEVRWRPSHQKQGEDATC